MRRARSNILVFFTDQQRWDSTGLHGNPLDLTPNLDEMARAGTHIANAFTPQPLCGPARAALQTGTYGTTSGCYRNDIPLSPESATLAKLFRSAGYETGYIGKWHLGRGIGSVPEEERGGYEYWLASNVLEFTSDAYRVEMYDGDGRPVRLPGYRVDALADAAIRFLAAERDRPFFLFLSFIEPHQQNSLDAFPAPVGYRERYAGRWMPPDLAALGGSAHRHLPGYYGMVRRLDEALGRVLDALRSLGMLDETIVLYASDHGCHFRTRNDEYKRSPHESSIRVPVALSGPGFRGGGRIEELVSLVDLAPTLLDAAGVAIPGEMQGCSIMPLLRREPAERPREVLVQVSEAQLGRALRTRRWKYGVVAPDQDGAVSPGAELYVEDCLYDLEADPYELLNLAGMESHREVAAALRARLVRRMVEAGEPAPEVVPAPSQTYPWMYPRVDGDAGEE